VRRAVAVRRVGRAWELLISAGIMAAEPALPVQPLHSSPGERGTALVEALVALALLLLAMLGVARLTLEAAAVASRAARATEALALATAIMEALQAAPPAPGGGLDRPRSEAGTDWFLDDGTHHARWSVRPSGAGVSLEVGVWPGAGVARGMGRPIVLLTARERP